MTPRAPKTGAVHASRTRARSPPSIGDCRLSLPDFGEGGERSEPGGDFASLEPDLFREIAPSALAGRARKGASSYFRPNNLSRNQPSRPRLATGCGRDESVATGADGMFAGGSAAIS